MPVPKGLPVVYVPVLGMPDHLGMIDRTLGCGKPRGPRPPPGKPPVSVTWRRTKPPAPSRAPWLEERRSRSRSTPRPSRCPLAGGDSPQAVLLAGGQSPAKSPATGRGLLRPKPPPYAPPARLLQRQCGTSVPVPCVAKTTQPLLIPHARLDAGTGPPKSRSRVRRQVAEPDFFAPQMIQPRLSAQSVLSTSSIYREARNFANLQLAWRAKQQMRDVVAAQRFLALARGGE